MKDQKYTRSRPDFKRHYSYTVKSPGHTHRNGDLYTGNLIFLDYPVMVPMWAIVTTLGGFTLIK